MSGFTVYETTVDNQEKAFKKPQPKKTTKTNYTFRLVNATTKNMYSMFKSFLARVLTMSSPPINRYTAESTSHRIGMRYSCSESR